MLRPRVKSRLLLAVATGAVAGVAACSSSDNQPVSHGVVPQSYDDAGVHGVLPAGGDGGPLGSTQLPDSGFHGVVPAPHDGGQGDDGGIHGVVPAPDGGAGDDAGIHGLVPPPDGGSSDGSADGQP
jgi:hypothetical protein